MPDAASHDRRFPAPDQSWSGQHDAGTMTLHWITAFLVVTLFALAEIWDFLPHGTARSTLELLHVSLGCLLVVTVLARLVWRGGFGRKLPHPGITGMLAQAGHGLLYLLLITMIVTGPLKRWTRDHGLDFFWLFKIPAPFAMDRAWHAPASLIHFWAAWAIIVVAGLHAMVALFHHHVLKDGVLRRMMPGRRPDNG